MNIISKSIKSLDISNSKYAVLASKVTKTFPPAITAATGMDVSVHAIKSYIVNSTTSKTRKQALQTTKLIYITKIIFKLDIKERVQSLDSFFLHWCSCFFISMVVFVFINCNIIKLNNTCCNISTMSSNSP